MGPFVMVLLFSLFKEALGMIWTFIIHSALRRSKGVEMSHTSFFKTGWECPTVRGGGLCTAEQRQLLYESDIFTRKMKLRLSETKQNKFSWEKKISLLVSLLVVAKSPRSARKYCNTGATAQEREQAQRLIHAYGSNITVNLICYRVTSTRD